MPPRRATKRGKRSNTVATAAATDKGKTDGCSDDGNKQDTDTPHDAAPTTSRVSQRINKGKKKGKSNSVLFISINSINTN